MIDKIILLLFELGFIVKFNIIGEISISELALLVYSFFLIKKIRYKRNYEIQKLTKLYIALVIVQVITEIIVENTLSNALKGIAINVVSYLHFLFLYHFFQKKRSLVIFAALGISIRYLIINEMQEEQGDLSAETAFLAFLKFRLVPIVSYGLVAMSVFRRKINLNKLYIYIGGLFIILGARSGGGILLVCGFLNVIFNIAKKLQIRNYGAIILISSVLFYGGYYFYVINVLNGEITSGNAEQLKRAENPFNPMNLLVVGRAETFVGYIAFTDKPLTGWGAWAKDPNMYYHILQAKISNNTNYEQILMSSPIIPSHSVIIGSGMMNGIFALIIILFIFIFIAKRGLQLIKIKDDYQIVITFFLIEFIWHMFFSPQSTFRYISPIQMAFIIVSYQLFFNKKQQLCQKYVL